MAANASAHLIRMFRTELWLTIEESLEDSYLMAAAFLASGLSTNLSQRTGQAKGDATEAIDRAAKRVSDKKREKLRIFMREHPHLKIERRRGGSTPRVEVSDEQCAQLSGYYSALLTHWQKVKRNRNREQNWRAYAKIDEPDTPDDLLDRLDAGEPQLPTEEDYPSIPSVIALEHAARRCGIPANEYSSSRLKTFASAVMLIEDKPKPLIELSYLRPAKTIRPLGSN